MPTIRPIVHVGPVPKVKKPSFKTKAQGAKTRIKRDAGNKFADATTRRARTPDGERIGRKPSQPELDPLSHEVRSNLKMSGGIMAFTGGAIGGGIAGEKYANKKHPVSKARYVKITTMGTAQEKFENSLSRWPHLPKKAAAGLAGGGAALGVHGGYKNQKVENEYFNRRKKKMAVAKRLNATPEERKKALLYNKDFTSKGPYTKTERRIAGKIMSKEQLKGQGKGFLAGGAAGAAAGAAASAASKGKLPRGGTAVVGGVFGGVGGQLRGDYTGRVKGQRKYKEALGKSSTASAFGVEHGEFSKYQNQKRKDQPSVGRVLLGGGFGPAHGVVAGDGPANKAKTMAAQTAGNLVAPVLGGGGATYIAHKQGWLKPQKGKKKNVRLR